MKRVVILATIHQYQAEGHDLNAKLTERISYLASKLGAEILMEEWSDKLGESVSKEFASKTKIAWANISPSEELKFRTYTGPINFPGHDGSLQPPDSNAPGMYEYGPFENQEAREVQMGKNIHTEMDKYETGLLVCGVAHLHSLFGKLLAMGFEVNGFPFT